MRTSKLRGGLLALAACLSAGGCTKIYVPDTEESVEDPEPVPPCELVWDRDEALTLEPLHGVNGALHRLVQSGADVVLVSTTHEPDGSSMIVTTRVVDPWGDLAVEPAVERGAIAGRPTVSVAWDGALTVYGTRQQYVSGDVHEYFVERALLPSTDAPASPAEPLEGVAAVLVGSAGFEAFVYRDTLSFDDDGDPESQRLRVVSLAGEELASYTGSTLTFIDVVPYFAGGSLLSFYDGWNNGDWDAHKEWFVRDDHGGNFPFESYRWFGTGPLMAVTWDEEVVQLEFDGTVVNSLGPLPEELRETEGDLTIVPWEQGHAIVSVKREQGTTDGALRVRAFPSPDRALLSAPLPANEENDGDGFAVLPSADARSLLVAYEGSPAFMGARLARLACK